MVGCTKEATHQIIVDVVVLKLGWRIGGGVTKEQIRHTTREPGTKHKKVPPLPPKDHVAAAALPVRIRRTMGRLFIP